MMSEVKPTTVENIRSRKTARVIGKVDFVLAAMTMITMVAGVVFVLTYKVTETKLVFYRWLAVVFILSFFVACLSLSASVNLIKATEKEREIQEALQSTLVWRIGEVTCLIVSAVELGVGRIYLGVVALILIRGAFIYYVNKFIRDLHKEIGLELSSAPSA